MKKNLMVFTFPSLVFVSCLFFLITGCGDKPVAEQKKVFSQKIVDEKTESSKGHEESQIPPLPPEIANHLERNSFAESQVQLTSKTESSTGESRSEMPDDSVPSLKGESQTPSSTTAYTYNPKGKIDPFLPWRSDERPEGIEPGKQVKKRMPMTPLEKVDLSQLKLVGIVLSASGNKALVEETSGKGFVITKGTYVGLNGGKVIDILKDKVIIEERVNYGVSGVSVRKRELTLQKPPGEE